VSTALTVSFILSLFQRFMPASLPFRFVRRDTDMLL
jgi:hypothetical protein